METVKNVGKKLYELAHENKTADAVVHALATRQRLRHFIDTRRLKYFLKKEGFGIKDNEYAKLWKEWEKLGLGKITKGRIGKDDLFVMNYDMRKVADASMKGSDLTSEDLKKGIVIKIPKAVKPPKLIQFAKPRPVVATPVAAPVPTAKQLIIGLDNGKIFVIDLPPGMTKNDIQRISDCLSQTI